MKHTQFLTEPGKSNKRLSPYVKVRNAILQERLNISEEAVQPLLKGFSSDVAKILNITDSAIEFDTEFFGRDLDVLFTINKQNTPSEK